MMNMKYLLKGVAALFVGMVAISCSHDADGTEQAEESALENAQTTLGFHIPTDQDWVMSSMANANVVIEGEAGKAYTVKFYSNNPLTDEIAYILDMREVEAGQHYVSQFRYPSALTSFYVGLTDAEGITTYKMAEIVNGSITSLNDIASARSITRTSLPNHNLWGDPTADGGIWNWNVPPALTPKQKLRVKAYFQANPNLTYEDPHLTNFFVQQVYKGNPQTKGPVSPEQYQSANNGWVIGSDHMDKLTVGTGGGEGSESPNFFNHVYNFNFGEYNGGATTTVLNTGASTNNYTAENTHQDQIMLMVNSKTDCVGYWNSDGSCGHNDRCALVSAEVIDQWAEEYGNNIGEAVVDGWNRSFVGLDFDQVVGDDVYAKGVSYQDANGEWKWDANRYATFEFKGQTYRFLSAETNRYCADRTEPTYHGVANFNDRPSDTIIEDLLRLGYLPYTDTLKDWVKVGGGRDFYYSDWIVTLTPADKIKKKEEKQIWSYAFEDSNLKSDYDMNDVVLKVQETMDGTQLKVTLAAAGCEYDNKVCLNGTVITWNGKDEVHNVFGMDHEKTINTGWSSRVPAAVTYINKPANYDPQTAAWTIVPSGGDMKDKPIGLAQTGLNPTGIVIPYDWAWPTERTSICDAYRTTGHSFAQWATSTAGDLRTSTSDWYKYPDTSCTMK